MKPLLVALFLLVGASARADDWTWPDTGLELAFATVLTIDWCQTTWAARNWPNVPDVNPLFNSGGKYDAQRVRLLFPAAIVGHAVVAALLPRPYRTAWQLTGIFVMGLSVTRNGLYLGVGVASPW